MRFFSVSAAILLSASIVACAKGGPPQHVLEQKKATESSLSDGSARPSSVQRQLIRSVDLEMSVDDTELAAAEVRRIVGETSGYVESLDSQRRDGLLFFRLALRVPADGLDSFIDSIKPLASRIDREIHRTQDVTDQIIDLDARLRALNATEQQLQALLQESRTRQQDVEAIMAVYRELTGVRTSIEQLLAQQEALKKQVTYSVVNLSIRPTASAKPVVGDRWAPSATVRASARTFVRLLQLALDVAIFFVIVLLPFGLVIYTPIWLFRKKRKRVTEEHSPGPK